MSDIFISYVRDDRPIAQKLAQALETQGWSVWWDRRIPAGRTFDEVIEEAIDGARSVVVLWSKNSVASRWVRTEAAEGAERNTLVPILIELDLKIPLAFRRIHAADLNGWDGEDTEALQDLIDALATILGSPPKVEQRRRQAEEKRKGKGEKRRRGEAGSKLEAGQAPSATGSSSRPSRTSSQTPLASKGSRKAGSPPARRSSRKYREPIAVPPVEPSEGLEAAGPVSLSPKDGLEYVWIQPGMFEMGRVPRDNESDDDETRHSVTISMGFWIGRTPVTVAAYKRFAKAEGVRMPRAPDFNPGWRRQDHPIVSVDWEKATAYCKWVGGRLPTEAEWEYAARSGKKGTKYPWGDRITQKDANFASNGTTPVRKYAPNGWGLYDVTGNAWEWTADWYGKTYYRNSPGTDPPGTKSGNSRVIRGGSWDFIYPKNLRLSCRYGIEPAVSGPNIGFRCVWEVPLDSLTP